jgi:hypothetical protein
MVQDVGYGLHDRADITAKQLRRRRRLTLPVTRRVTPYGKTIGGPRRIEQSGGRKWIAQWDSEAPEPSPQIGEYACWRFERKRSFCVPVSGDYWRWATRSAAPSAQDDVGDMRFVRRRVDAWLDRM